MAQTHSSGNFARNIRPDIDAELLAADALSQQGQAQNAFAHLERAHVLGQAATTHHIRVHWRMFLWGMQQRNVKECLGQVLRIIGAATKTVFGLIPHGNTGGSNVSPFKAIAVPAELEMRMEQARRLN